MVYDDLNDENFLMYAIKCYDNPSCTGLDEFNEDLNHIVYLKRLFNKYINGGELKRNLIYSHLNLLLNVFGPDAPRILFYRTEEKHWPVLKTFLVGLSKMPDRLVGIRKDKPIIRTVEIPLEPNLFNTLREIVNVNY
tara:strand:+ start:30021 stop:30431 length:411 start_codon:yes stop_codon:yes gene_type:complete